MNKAMMFLILVAGFLGVFVQAAWDLPRNLFGAPINFLPPLLVFAAFRSDVITISLLAGLGGLWTDALSANPFGVSVLPLFWVGLALHHWRDLILQELVYARFVVGLFASAVVPLLTVLAIMTMGRRTVVSWALLWQWLVAVVIGGLLTPLCFWVLDMAHERLFPRPVEPPSFRPDREIKRGRF